ncbi:hypothetical protein GCM10025867_50240 (plasmid) [Frondihabitans sucicola]|uniref:Uncharacterized protein n=1 Tax=Frondihabitans sucicola TaxID=1268041 RepID=A0ABN6Y6H2_9MICO|nr:hypothetical protein [Frondihabitans sucicola]BDZ52783.1 hypothetical protein GCM10025867_50240 [Frondihabitans sucicola]
MDINVNFDFTIDFVPPRCRNARPTKFTSATVVTVAETTEAEAPVGIRAQDTEYRLHDGRLWVKREGWVRDGEPVDMIAGTEAFPAEVHRNAGYVTEREAKADLAAEYADMLIVDGWVYDAQPEPTYSYITLGLDLHPAWTIGPVNPQSPTSHFSARDREAFLAAMRSCVTDNNRDGDPARRLEYIELTPVIEVLIDDAAQFVTPTRAEYFKARWDSYYERGRAAVVDSLGATALPSIVDQVTTDLFEHLVATLGEWGVVRALGESWDWRNDVHVMRSPEVIADALAALKVTGGAVKRTTLAIEFVHDGDFPDVAALLAQLSALGAGEAYLTTRVEHPVPDATVDVERERLAATSAEHVSA